MDVLLELPRLHQLAVTTRSQVDQTCPMRFIFSHVFIQRRSNEVNQLDTSAVEAIGNRFKGIVPKHGIIQQLDFSYCRSLDASFQFKIRGRLLSSHAVLRLTVVIYPEVFSIILGTIMGWHHQKSFVVSFIHGK